MQETFPKTLTRLLYDETVKLPKKLAAPWSAFQKLKVSQRLTGDCSKHVCCTSGSEAL